MDGSRWWRSGNPDRQEQWRWRMELWPRIIENERRRRLDTVGSSSWDDDVDNDNNTDRDLNVSKWRDRSTTKSTRKSTGKNQVRLQQMDKSDEMVEAAGIRMVWNVGRLKIGSTFSDNDSGTLDGSGLDDDQ